MFTYQLYPATHSIMPGHRCSLLMGYWIISFVEFKRDEYIGHLASPNQIVLTGCHEPESQAGAGGLTLGSRIPGLEVSRSKHVQVRSGQLRGPKVWHFLRRYTSQASTSGKSPHDEKNESRNILHLAMQLALIEAGLYIRPTQT